MAYAKLATKLEVLGYQTRRTKHGFELAGIDDALVRKFSRRTEEIEKLAQELGITDAAQKAKLGARRCKGCSRHRTTKRRLPCTATRNDCSVRSWSPTRSPND